MTSSCVSKMMLELQHFPTGFGWRKHSLPVPCGTQQAATLQYLDVPFWEQSFAITPSREQSKSTTDNRAIPWLLGFYFHTCDTLVFVLWVTRWLRYAIAMWGKRPSKGARSDSDHTIKLVPPFQWQPTQLGLSETKFSALDFCRKQLFWTRRWFGKVESRSGSPQCQYRGHLTPLEVLAVPSWITLLSLLPQSCWAARAELSAEHSTALATRLSDGSDSTLHCVCPLLLGNCC